MAISEQGPDAEAVPVRGGRQEDQVWDAVSERVDHPPQTRWPVPSEYHDDTNVIPFGQAAVRREGTDVTIVATLAMVHRAMAVADELEREGISVEVIDPRTLVPFDRDTIVGSVRKTGRLLVVDEAYQTFGIHGEVIATVVEHAFDSLVTPPRRLGNPGVPVPFAPPLEDAVLPSHDRIAQLVRELVAPGE